MATADNKVEMRLKSGQKQGTEAEVELSSDGEVNVEDDTFLDWVKTQFSQVAGESHSIGQAEFKHALGIKNNYFAERFFYLFDKGHSGSIDLTEFIDGMTLLARGSPTQKLKFLFDAYDVDGNGTIDPDELKTVMKHCMEESDLQLSEEALETLTLALFEHADADNTGVISFEALCAVLEKHPNVMKNLTISAAKWMKPPKGKATPSGSRPAFLTKNYWINNKKAIIWAVIYFLINIGLFFTCIRYRHYNAAVIIARGCGMCLNFNSAFILVLMLRKTLTWLRMTPLAHILPIDHNVMYHRNVGYVIVLLSLVHTVAHYVNVGLLLSGPVSALPTTKYWEVAFTLKSGVGYVGPGFAFLSGFILMLLLLVMFVCALPCIRRNGHFEVFYFTHLLYLVFWVLLILHGPIFWYFFIVPGIIFILEKTVPTFLRRAKGKKFYIKKVTLLPSKVTHLVISPSGRFHFRAGDYVFIKIPCIAKFEYHPFTISSAPERDGEFWLHVRSTGHWTQNLHKYFEEYGQNSEEAELSRKSQPFSFRGSKIFSRVTSLKRSVRQSKKNRESQIETWRKKYKTKEVNIQVSIRGPYGTPTREIFDTEHAVLIASGIGVTPFASILQSIAYRVRAAKKTCPHCTRTFLDQDSVTEDMNLRKVDFIWINRQQQCFEWFVSLLNHLEEEGEADSGFDGFLDMTMYMTSALSMNDMKGFGLQVALEAMQRKGQRNVLTGLRSSLKPGRPHWDTVFSDIKAQKKGAVKVFYCGNPALAKVLKQHCDKFGFAFSKESF